MKTYTTYKLTDPMLQRLSKTCKGRRAGGVSMPALESRGLVERRISCARHGETWGAQDCGCGAVELTWHPTAAGREALARARREGW